MLYLGTLGIYSLNSLYLYHIVLYSMIYIYIYILIKWTTHKHAFQTDMQNVYNDACLDQLHWRYQLYL